MCFSVSPAAAVEHTRALFFFLLFSLLLLRPVAAIVIVVVVVVVNTSVVAVVVVVDGSAGVNASVNHSIRCCVAIISASAFLISANTLVGVITLLLLFNDVVVPDDPVEDSAAVSRGRPSLIQYRGGRRDVASAAAPPP